MIETLILCRKNETTKFLVNQVLSKIHILRLVGIANDLDEALNLIKTKKPNLIITSNEKLISLITNNSQNYSPRIALLTKDVKNSIYFTRNILHIQYNLSSEDMTKQLEKFMTEYLAASKKEELLRILNEIGFNLKLSGTMYLIEAIIYAALHKDAYSFEKLEKDIYHHVALQNNTSTRIVKWSIERSIRYLHESLTKESYAAIEKYLAVEYPKKPTPKLVINTLSNIILL